MEGEHGRETAGENGGAGYIPDVRNIRTVRDSRALTLALALVLAMAAGCTQPVTPVTRPDAARSRGTPEQAVWLVGYDWNHRAAADYTQLLTDDFQFVFAPGDTTWGLPGVWSRETEVATVLRMFDPSAPSLTLTTLKLDFDRQLIPLPDPRPGKHPKWHRTVRTGVDLDAEVSVNGTVSHWRVVGSSLFFLVRGDSAAIPEDLASRGVVPDSTQWWIQRWEDETLPPAPGSILRTTPCRDLSLAQLKSLFRAELPAAPRR